ncbi:TetR/AcrR family transcriptional regulator [Rhodoferax sp. PAMC 29310]|uniref:TetR/AcrR family transcriptional regulator n=1 Tax=Rhodoferax sp. PAMC 29310 TaxID=2822760 RepID=UPI001B32D974|nr:TetR/AcrR family transcriptional regulator [Rhodoferax sp. PAMC 29310]
MSTHKTKIRLLAAALQVIRARGYCATTVDDICEAAGVTKGSFFHHFKGKEDLAVSAADYWGETTSAFFAAAPYHTHADALDRLLGYIDFRQSILNGPLPEFTCLVGTMVQETFDSAPAIRDACERCISGHAVTLVPDIAQAMVDHGLDGATAGWTADSLALHTQAVLQGAFILAKARGEGGAQVAAESVAHLRRYVELLFGVHRGPKFA